MLYVRNIFKQDLSEGKQIAFTKEPSNIFFNFNYSTPDPDRDISLKFKVDDPSSSFIAYDNTIIKTRLYAARSESRIDSELKTFLRDKLDAKIDDIIVFRRINKNSFVFEFIPSSSSKHGSFETILNSKNHKVILDQASNLTEDESNDFIQSNKIREFLFDVFKMLNKEFGDEFLTKKLANAQRRLSETSYDAYIFPDYFNSKAILGSFSEEQSEESLKTSNTSRFFAENLDILGQEYLYFTTQWGFPQYQNSPDFISFNQFVLDYSDKKYRIEYNEEHKTYKLILNKKQKIVPQVPFAKDSFQTDVKEAGLILSPKLVQRFISSLITKPFVILSGLSGSGKTKLAQAFTQWICQNQSQYSIVPVGADWTNREPLLGYPNALKTDEYIKPDNRALDVIINANNYPTLPHFLILDEMNLSHVERYFADFLSVMESKGEISLYGEGTVNNGVPSKLSLPSNLFIIGTVNIDETTYMFSPKVLDRANAIEFRVTKDEIKNFFASHQDVNMEELKTKGESMAEDFLKKAENKEFEERDLTEIHKTLVSFFSELKKTGAEYGYRSASEIIRLINQLSVIAPELSDNEKLDIAIMQKLLPKLHGSRRKLEPVLVALGKICAGDKVVEDFFENKDERDYSKAKYELSLEKITRMYDNLINNGFASYAEA